MKIINLLCFLGFLALISEPLCCAADSTPIDFTKKADNDTGYYFSNKFSNKNTTDITLPAGMFKPSENGKLMLNTDGSSGSQGDDFSNKPRPPLDSESLTGLISIEKAMNELLDYIDWLLEKPRGELDDNLLGSAIDELTALDEARARQNKKKPIYDVMSSIPEEEQFLFTQQPGFQENHPAHPPVGGIYTVPGVLMLAGGKTSSEKSGTTSNKSAPPQGGSEIVQNPLPKGTSERPGGNGGASNNLEIPSEATAVTQEYFERTIEQEGQSRTFRCEITEDNQDLKCLICLDLVSLKENNALVCRACQIHQCIDCVKHQMEPDSCSQCKVSFSTVSLNLRINRLKWQCLTCDEKSITLPDMVRHTECCNPIETCSNPSCGFSGTHDELESHAAECIYQTVTLGSIPLLLWEKNFIEQQMTEIPDSFGAETQVANPAGIAVTLLLEKIRSASGSLETDLTPESQLLCQTCPACCHPFESRSLKAHLEVCQHIFINCDCGATLKRGNLDKHKTCQCTTLTTCPLCGEIFQSKELNHHTSMECAKRLVSCKNPDCNDSIPYSELEAHLGECEYSPLPCKICEASVKRKEMDEHRLACMFVVDFDGRKMRRNFNINLPTYSSHEPPETFIIFVPTAALRDKKTIDIGSIPTNSGHYIARARLESDRYSWLIFRAVYCSRLRLACLTTQGQCLFHFASVWFNQQDIAMNSYDYPVCKQEHQLPADPWVVFRLTILK